MESQRRRTWRVAVSAAALVTAAVTIAPAAVTAAVPAVPAAGQQATASTWVPDGSSQERAAASCWEIKQRVRTATDGVYWLVTPALVAPQQFYCDMTTDGGGWVLIGRGRDGWSESGDAQGTPAQVRQDVWSQAGFKPKKLSDDVIEGLLNGGAPSALSDGVRIVRAADSTGASTTDLRARLTAMPSWSWAFSAGQPTNATAYAASTNRNTAGRKATTVSRTTTQLISTGSAWTTLSTTSNADIGWVAGWHYGQSALGQNSATSFLYSVHSRGYWATPMTQIWLRPQLSTADLSYPQLPDAGAPKSEQLPLAQSAAMIGTWGVTGQANGNDNELNTEAHAFAQIGDVMYVGGNFARVEEHAARTPTSAASRSIAQSYLAAFDVRTGDWIPGFRPTFNNQVNSLAALPNGDLAVGGQFTTVNGRPQAGLVALDPATGATDAGWKITVENRISGEAINVQTMDLQGGWLYLGGNFTHFTGGTSPYAVYARKAARLDAATATPDKNWNPAFDGKVQAIDASSDGTRVYAAGYFTKAGSTPAMKEAIVSTGPGAALIPFSPEYSYPVSAYQQSVDETGATFWFGGAEHSMFGYTTASGTSMSKNIARSGGDFQAITDNADRVVYGGCHCGDWIFNGQSQYTMTIPDPSPSWKQAHRLDFVGAWNAQTGAYLPAFLPSSKSRGGFGVWGMTVDSNGTLWAGGSYTSAVATDGRNQWAGGFVRFAVRPHTAPDAPTDLSVSLAGSQATLTWTAPSGTPGASYEVLRGGRVVATTTKTTIQVPESSSGDRFFVRATDGAGNRSATTPVALPRGEVIAPDAAWKYAVTAQAYAAWTSTGFDDKGWSTGAAPLGWGDPSLATDLQAPTGEQRPITTYYRHSFDVAAPKALRDLTVVTRADDGIVVYLNGREIGRKNMPAGPVTASTCATAAMSTAAATADPLRIDLDPAQLVAGHNVIAVEVHANYRSTPTISMALTLLGGTP